MTPAAPEQTARQAASRAVTGIVLLLATAIVLAHLGLIVMGQWRIDEYWHFRLLRDEGWSYLGTRLLTWGFRPVSEAMIGLYAILADRLRQPLIGPALAVPWCLLIGALLYPVWRAGPGTNRLARLLLASVLMAAFLLGHRVAEMFYWPMGALAYMTTLAAVSLLVFEVAEERWRTPAGQWLCVAALIAAAGCSEVGAMFAACFAGLMLLVQLARPNQSRAKAAVWLVPLAFAGLALLLVALGRGTSAERLVPESPTLRHVLPSLALALQTTMRQAGTLDGGLAGRAAFAHGIGARILLFLGFLAVWRIVMPARLSRGGQLTLLALLLSLVATCWVSIAATYYQFGVLCCERHDALRQSLLVLAELALAGLAAGLATQRRPPSAWRGLAAPALLGAALLWLGVPRLPDLLAAYRYQALDKRVVRDNWRSGLSPGEGMRFTLLPTLPLVGGDGASAAGRFTLQAQPPWFAEAVLKYFRKSKGEFIPWQP